MAELVLNLRVASLWTVCSCSNRHRLPWIDIVHRKKLSYFATSDGLGNRPYNHRKGVNQRVIVTPPPVWSESLSLVPILLAGLSLA